MQYITGILLFCFIILFHEFGHFIMAKLNGVGVTEFAIGFGPKLFSKKIGETTYLIKAIPFGGYCAMIGEEEDVEDEELKKKAFSNKSLWQRFLIVFAGPLFNFILALLCAIPYITFFGSQNPAKIVAIEPNSPAYEANLQVDDIIVEINNRHIAYTNDINAYNATHGGETYNIKVERNGNIENITLTPKMNEETGFYVMGVKLDSSYTFSGRSFTNIMKYSYYEMRYWIRMVFDSFHMLFNGSASVKDMSGVVGVVNIVGDSIEEAASYSALSVLSTCLFITIFLSINLGIMNLLPLPALDGGRCLLYLIEMIFSKKLPTKVENAMNTIGFVALFVLMILVCVNDVFRIFVK